MLDRIPDELWEKFENIAVAVAIAAAMVALGFVLYFKATI